MMGWKQAGLKAETEASSESIACQLVATAMLQKPLTQLCAHQEEAEGCMLGQKQACLEDEAEAVAPEGQEGIHLLLCGRLPFQVESQGDCGLLQLHIQAGDGGLEGVADLQPAGGVLSLRAVSQLHQAATKRPPARLQ